MKQFGFGQSTGSGYPGESSGTLNPFNTWSEIEMATLSFGYGLSVTPLQLVHAYSVVHAMTSNNSYYINTHNHL